MARWDNDTYAADEYKTSDGRTFGTRGEADRHQDELDGESSSSSSNSNTSGSSGPIFSPADGVVNTVNKAVRSINEGRYDEAIELCDKALKDCSYPGYWNKDGAIGFAFTVRGSAYDHKGMREKALQDFTEGADYENSQARKILANMGVAYTPKRPSTYSDFHPDYGRPVFIHKSAPKDKDEFLNSPNVIFTGIPFGIGLMFAAGWVYLQVTGAERLEIIPALIIVAVATLVTGLFIYLKKWIVVILLALLAVAGYLVLFGVIPERLDLGKTAAAAAVQTNSATVISDGLNLRAEASGSAAVVKTLKNGDTLTITGEAAGGWTPVEHEGDRGWVSSQYLEKN